MKVKETTAHERMLFDALTAEGIFTELGYCDDHKCVDLRLPEIHLNIEVDGKNHYTDPEQIMNDFLRDDYSEKEGFDTFRIPNEAIEKHLKGIVKAIRQIISRKRTLKNLDKQTG